MVVAALVTVHHHAIFLLVRYKFRALSKSNAIDESSEAEIRIAIAVVNQNAAMIAE